MIIYFVYSHSVSKYNILAPAALPPPPPPPPFFPFPFYSFSVKEYYVQLKNSSSSLYHPDQLQLPNEEACYTKHNNYVQNPLLGQIVYNYMSYFFVSVLLRILICSLLLKGERKRVYISIRKWILGLRSTWLSFIYHTYYLITLQAAHLCSMFLLCVSNWNNWLERQLQKAYLGVYAFFLLLLEFLEYQTSYICQVLFYFSTS